MKKVKIYITYYSYYQYMSYQLKSFNKFIKDDTFEVIILNNATNHENWENINKVSSVLGLRTIDVINKVDSTPNYSHSHAITWAYSNYMKQDNGISLFMDSDIFLYDYFNFNEYMEGYAIAGHRQSKTNENGNVAHYFWPGLLCFDMSILPDKDQIDLRCGCIDGVNVDVGGHMWYYLRSHPDVKYKPIRSSNQICENNNNMVNLPKQVHEKYNNEFMITRISKSMIHAGAGCNWNYQSNKYMKDKRNFIFDLIDDSIAGKIDWSKVPPVEKDKNENR